MPKDGAVTAYVPSGSAVHYIYTGIVPVPDSFLAWEQKIALNQHMMYTYG